MLRRAAALIRERAEAARTSIPEVCPEWHSKEALMAHGKTEGDAEHIASWHPAVALAVADWLDREAVEHERYVSQAVRDSTVRTAYADERARHALAVARAYLGT